MKTIQIHKIETPRNPSEYADFAIDSLTKLGIGEVSADLRNVHDEVVEWLFISRATGEQKVLFTVEQIMFRPILAQIGFRIMDNPYRGQQTFQVRYENENTPAPFLFSLFLCNEAETAVWIKLYRYK